MLKLNRPYWAALAFAILALAALQIDVDVARYAGSKWRVGDLRKLIDISEAFAHGLGVLMILISVFVLDPAARRKLPRVAACAYGAGLVAQLIKIFVPRVRPRHFEYAGDVFSSFLFRGTDGPQSMAHLTGRAVESFPSGHTATAVGLAFGLAWLYPRGKWLFASFATLAAIQRIQSSAHFPSDTLAAASIACLIAGLCLDHRALGRRFVGIEKKTGGELKESLPGADGNNSAPNSGPPRQAA